MKIKEDFKICVTCLAIVIVASPVVLLIAKYISWLVKIMGLENT